MVTPLILASGSEIRAKLLKQAALDFEIEIPYVDEEMIKTSMCAEGASPRDLVDALAEHKAKKIAHKFPNAMVIGCDQILEFNGKIISKPKDKQQVIDQMGAMKSQTHQLLSAAVVYHEGKPVWRHIGKTRLTMKELSDAYIHDYVERNWESIRYSLGGYKLEEEGVRLFQSIQGDYFHVLGLPLLELLSFLTIRGVIKQ